MKHRKLAAVTGALISSVLAAGLVAFAAYMTSSAHRGTVNTAPPNVTVTNVGAQAVSGGCSPSVISGAVVVAWEGAAQGAECLIRVGVQTTEQVRLQKVTIAPAAGATWSPGDLSVTAAGISDGCGVTVNSGTTTQINYKLRVSSTAPRGVGLDYQGQHQFVLPADYSTAACT